MKKNLLTEYETQIREHIEELYQRAYAVKGNKQDAEVLTEDIIVFGAKKYAGLANKARVIDIMMQKLGEGTNEGFEPCDPEALLSRAIGKVKVQDKKNRMFASIGASVAVLAIVFGVVIHSILSGNQDYGVLIMKNTDTVSGDLGTLSLVNIHNVSENIGKKGAYEANTDYKAFLIHMADSIIAPNGTTYMVYQNLEKEDGSNTTFSLYEMTETEWRELGKGETSAEYEEVTETIHTYESATLYMIADERSNLYVFTILNGAIVVYKYDQKTECFGKLQEEYPSENFFALYFSLDYDSEYGEKGTVYIGITDTIRVEVAYFDIATESFACFCESVYPNVPAGNINICAKNHIIYLLVDGYADNRQLTYCAISEGGEFAIKPIKLNSSSNIINGMELIDVDSITLSDDGTVHAIVTRSSYRDKEENRLVHYAISIDGTVEREVLNPLFFEDSEYYPLGGICVFSEENDIYFIEHYKDIKDFFAIGKIASDGTVSCVDSFTLSQGIEAYGLRVHGRSVMFRSEEDIWHFAFASEKE